MASFMCAVAVFVCLQMEWAVKSNENESVISNATANIQQIINVKLLFSFLYLCCNVMQFNFLINLFIFYGFVFIHLFVVRRMPLGSNFLFMFFVCRFHELFSTWRRPLLSHWRPIPCRQLIFTIAKWFHRILFYSIVCSRVMISANCRFTKNKLASQRLSLHALKKRIPGSRLIQCRVERAIQWSSAQ